MKTLNQIADELKVSPYKLDYLVKSRRISCNSRIGTVRMFNQKTIEKIVSELKNVRPYRYCKGGNNNE